MTQPWDGTGQDPWLESRAGYEADAAAAERSMREAVWAELSSWITGVARAVLRYIRPNPLALFSRQPAWSRSVERIVSGPITDTIGIQYGRLLGDGYDFQSRPMVINHLASAENRLVRVPDTVYKIITDEIARGVNTGESAAELSTRIDNVLSTTKTERWPNRANVIARTETLSSLNAGRTDSFAVVSEALGKPMEQMWISTLDGRTRTSHKSADGQRVPIGGMFRVGGASLLYPGDPMGPAHEVIQCRCSSILVEPGEYVDLSARPIR